MYPRMNGDMVWNLALTPANLDDFGVYVSMVSQRHDRNYGSGWTEIHHLVQKGKHLDMLTG